MSVTRAAQGAVPATLGRVDVRVIGLDHLKANKPAAGRHQVLTHLERLP